MTANDQPDVLPLDFLRLFPEFLAPSWAAWRRILARLTPDVREFYAVAGRGSGKSRIVALLACVFACREYARVPGELIFVGVFAPDRRQARVTFRYVVGLLRSVPTLAALIVNETRESVELAHGVVVEVITASTAAPRSRAYALAIVEEAAFLPTDESANPDVELVRALGPALGRVRGSLLAVVSSPYARRGLLWTATQKYAGREAAETPGVVFVQADTAALNPTFDGATIARAYGEDAIGARTEYGAEFRQDVETYVALEVVEAAVMPGRHEVPPVAEVDYFAFCDPSGGSADSFTLAVGHREGERVVLDAVRERRPPFSPEVVVGEYAELLATYRCAEVTGDRYAGEFPREQFRKRGIDYVVSARSKSDLYRDALPVLNSARLELLDVPRLVAQIAGLERRTGRGGRDSIDHAPGGHDDVANVALGLAATITATDERPRFLMLSGDAPALPVAVPAPRPPAWTDEELAAVGVFRMRGVWTHSLGDDHAQRVVSGVIGREAALRAERKRKADVFSMRRAEPARRT